MGYRLNRLSSRLRLPVIAPAWAAVAFALYAPALRSPFLFDDYTAIVANPAVARVGSFLPPRGPRDVGFLSFALNFAASGLDPLPYHAVNVAIHAVNALLVFALLRRVADHLAPPSPGAPPADPGVGRVPSPDGAEGGNRLLAAAASLLFLVHPLQTGAVSYVVQRFTSLCTLFYLLSFLAYLAASGRYRREGRILDPRHLGAYLLSVASAILAMKTKEIAFTIPIAILAWEVLFRRKGAGGGERRVPAAYYLPFALSLLVVPAHYLGASPSTEGVLAGLSSGLAETREIGRWEYLLTETRVLVTYVRLLFLPARQNLDYDYAVSKSLLEPAVLLSLAFHALLAATAARLYRRHGSGRILVVPFGILWFYLALSVESTVVPIRDVIFEHRVYLPMAGAAAATAAGAAATAGRFAGERGRRALPVLLAVAILLLSALTIRRNLLWSDGFGVWRDAAARSPGKARPRANLALLYQERGMLAEAAGEYVAALRIDPSLPLLHNNLGNVLKLMGRNGEAFEEYRRAVACDSRFAEGWYNLGVALLERGDRPGALDALSRAISLSPAMHEAYVALGNLNDAAGRKEEALRLYAVAIGLRPDYEMAWYNRGVLREGMGDVEGAREDYRRALDLSPSLEPARRRLGALGSPAPAGPPSLPEPSGGR